MIIARVRNNAAILSLLGALCALSGCDYFNSPGDRAAQAEKMLADGRYREAAIELRTGIDESPKDVRLHLMLARTALALGVLDSAEKAIADSAAAGADESSLGELRAQLLLDAGKAADLLAAIDGKKIVIAEERRDAWRVQALAALDRCEELIPPARARLERDAGETTTRIAIAECYARLGNRERALAEIDSGLRVAPDDSLLHLSRSQTLAALDRRRESEASLKRSVELAPGQLSVPRQVLQQLALADIHVLQDDLAGLRATHQRLIELAPQAPVTEMVGARLQLMQGEIAAAQNALRKLASAEGEPPTVHILLVAAYISQANLEQARLELTWLQRNAPQLALLEPMRGMLDKLADVPAESEEYLLRVAAAQATLGQMDLARKALAAAQSRSPQSNRAGILGVQLELRNGSLAKALEAAEKLAAANPASEELQLAHAEALRANDRHADADKLFAASFARAPSMELALTLHRLRLQHGLPDPNAPLISWLETHPRDVVIRGTYADALRIAGDNRQALAEYTKVAELAPRNAVALNNLAWVQYLEKDARAVATARRAWDLAPNAPVVADTLGWILAETGAVAESVSLLEKADAAMGVANPEVRYHRAAALARAGRRDEARALLEAFLPEWRGLAHHDEAARLLESLRQSGGT